MGFDASWTDATGDLGAREFKNVPPRKQDGVNYMTESWDSTGNAVFSKCEVLLSDWLTEEGADRVDIDYQAIHLTGRVRVWLTQGGGRKSVHLPSEVDFEKNESLFISLVR